MKSIKFNFKNIIFLLFCSIFTNSVLSGMRTEFKNTAKKTISRNKKHTNLKSNIINDLIEREQGKNNSINPIEIIINLIQTSVFKELENSKQSIKETIQLYITDETNNELVNQIDLLIKNAKEKFSDKSLIINLLIKNELKIQFPSFFEICDSNPNLNEFLSNTDLNELIKLINQYIFDEIFIKKIIVEIYSNYVSIRKLDLNSNGLIEIPTNLENLKNLEYLNLSFNQILNDNLNKQLLIKLSNLKYLNLENDFDEEDNDFPESIGNLNAIKTENGNIYLSERFKLLLLKEKQINKIKKEIKESLENEFYQIYYYLTHVYKIEKNDEQQKEIIKLLTKYILEKVYLNINKKKLINNPLNNVNKIVPNNFLEKIYLKTNKDFYKEKKKTIEEIDNEISTYLRKIIRTIIINNLI